MLDNKLRILDYTHILNWLGRLSTPPSSFGGYTFKRNTPLLRFFLPVINAKDRKIKTRGEKTCLTGKCSLIFAPFLTWKTPRNVEFYFLR